MDRGECLLFVAMAGDSSAIAGARYSAHLSQMLPTSAPCKLSSNTGTESSRLGLLCVLLPFPFLNLTHALPQTFPESVTLRSAALSFYEASLSLPLEHELHVVAIPSPSVTYTCLLASESMSISRICGIIAKSVSFFLFLCSALTAPTDSAKPSPAKPLPYLLATRTTSSWSTF